MIHFIYHFISVNIIVVCMRLTFSYASKFEVLIGSYDLRLVYADILQRLYTDFYNLRVTKKTE